jgi:hypothetical protein
VVQQDFPQNSKKGVWKKENEKIKVLGSGKHEIGTKINIV